jgi:twitching motility protein PilJ
MVELKKESDDYNNTVDAIIITIKKLEEGKQAAKEALPLFEQISNVAANLKIMADNDSKNVNLQKNISYVLFVIGFLLSLLLIWSNSIATRKNAYLANKEREDTDDAVVRLMGELIPISEGNLAARSTVTEHVTGALADRINYMAESLQEAIKQTRTATASVSENMNSVRDLIQKAADLTNTADSSAKESNTASMDSMELVKIAADKMEESRDKMQETSKRVKRLGEVSQSISSVADIIEELTEKTAILALNTQLKAAEAGEEGKSFRIIAEEIRKLSEEAKKSLETIRLSVQNMQSETKVVIQSIEQTTANVVDSSKLWSQADASLIRIKDASMKIAKITESLGEISAAQISAANKAEGNMAELQTQVANFTV